MIKAVELCKSYGDKKVIDSLSFEIADSEKIVISGESGAGKTTLLRLIAGLEKPDSGSLTGYGTGDISFMFQEPRLFPWEKLITNVTAPVGSKKTAAAKEMLSALGLGNDLDKYPDELSGGMKQRAALVRALLYDKKILILDEPFSSLDPGMKAVCARLIKSLSKDKTVILVSHDSADQSLLFDAFSAISLRSEAFPDDEKTDQKGS